MLDESTSALDLASERRVYGALVARGIAVVSVGHRASLAAFHDRILVLDGDGGWTIQRTAPTPEAPQGHNVVLDMLARDASWRTAARYDSRRMTGMGGGAPRVDAAADDPRSPIVRPKRIASTKMLNEYARGEAEVVANVTAGPWRTLRALWSTFVPSWRSRESGMVIVLFLIAVAEGAALLQLQTSLGGAVKSIVVGDRAGFYRAMLVLVLLVCVSSVVFALRGVVRTYLGAWWLASLTRRLLTRYFSDYTYYRVSALDKRIDNPDRRLVDDAAQVPSGLASSGLASIGSNALTAVLKTGVSVVTAALVSSWVVPAVLVAYLAVSVAILRPLMRRLAAAQFVQDRLEGDFRFRHLELRGAAESLAFFGAPVVSAERAALEERFALAMANSYRVVIIGAVIDGVSNFFDSIPALLGYVCTIIASGAGARVRAPRRVRAPGVCCCVQRAGTRAQES